MLLSVSIVPMFLEAIATHGTGLTLEIGGGLTRRHLAIAASAA